MTAEDLRRVHSPDCVVLIRNIHINWELLIRCQVFNSDFFAMINFPISVQSSSASIVGILRLPCAHPKVRSGQVTLVTGVKKKILITDDVVNHQL